MVSNPIIGIDLGTTNSVAAFFHDGKLEVIEEAGEAILPSAVSLSLDGQVLIGTPAYNSSVLYPERTILSVKRKMGSNEKIVLGEQTFSPQEISALILKKLVMRASQQLGVRVKRAVITVPAYFNDAQRQATREAGEIAGLEVMRLLHEPTAAALAYETQEENREVLVYDLGGGTFDVSLVRIQEDITEVLSSHGDTHLGGDDLDTLLLEKVAAHCRTVWKGVDPSQEPRARARLRFAVREARCELSSRPFARIREEALMHQGRRPLHLEYELNRQDFETLARPLILRTLESVHRVLTDTSRQASSLGGVLLAGGVTRTPLVYSTLAGLLGKEPRRDLHPDLCVAQGAAVLASRLAGELTQRILVDVSPYSYGPSMIGVLNGRTYEYRFVKTIERNTPLPASRTVVGYTVGDQQERWAVEIFQGEHDDALQNILIGRFEVEGLSRRPAGNPILCRLDLDPNGILHVIVTEKASGLTKKVTIENALQPIEAPELKLARERLLALLPPDAANSQPLDPELEATLEQELAAMIASYLPDDVEGLIHSLRRWLEELTSVHGPSAYSWLEGRLLAHHLDIEDLQDGGDDLYDADDEEEDGNESGGEDAMGDEAGELSAVFRSGNALMARCGELLELMQEEEREEAATLMTRMKAAQEIQDVGAFEVASAELSDLVFYVESR